MNQTGGSRASPYRPPTFNQVKITLVKVQAGRNFANAAFTTLWLTDFTHNH